MNALRGRFQDFLLLAAIAGMGLFLAAIVHAALVTPPTDTGGWAYVNDPTDANYGTVYVDCTHTDAQGTSWTLY